MTLPDPRFSQFNIDGHSTPKEGTRGETIPIETPIWFTDIGQKKA